MKWSLENNSWKDRKRLKAERYAYDIPSERKRPKDKATRFFKDNEYVENYYLAKLPPLCTTVLDALLKHCNTETQMAFPSLETVMELVGEKNPRSTSRAIQILEEYGIIIVQRGLPGFGRSNLYVFQSSRYWKPINKNMKRIRISTWKPTYQKSKADDIKSDEQASKTNEIDTLTNLNNNSPKELNNRMRSLADQMSIHKRQRLAIPNPSGNIDYVPPWRRDEGNLGKNRDKNEPPYAGEMQDDIPVNTGKLRERSTINFDNIEPEITVEKRSEGDINIDNIQPLKNGEKRDELDEIERKRAEESEDSIYLPDIRNDDMSAGTAG
jgi:hypothetical protein